MCDSCESSQRTNTQFEVKFRVVSAAAELILAELLPVVPESAYGKFAFRTTGILIHYSSHTDDLSLLCCVVDFVSPGSSSAQFAVASLALFADK